MTDFLITGAAGFIGSHMSRRILREGLSVVGLDNLNDYYDVRLKEDRLAQLESQPGFEFAYGDVADWDLIHDLMAAHRPRIVIHLAAQAGVRAAEDRLRDYVESNLVGFAALMEAARHFPPQHLLFASSSSVYGGNRKQPFDEEDRTDSPLSVYAATKKSNELMAHAFSHLYGLPMTGLRFFTVYGPWGRPDMAAYKFTEAIHHGRPIDVYAEGRMRRDFTYIDDVVESIWRLCDAAPNASETNVDSDAASSARLRTINVGRRDPVPLSRFIGAIETALNRQAKRRRLPAQPGEVYETHANVRLLDSITQYRPCVSVEEGVERFVDWYLNYEQSAKEVGK